MSLNFVVFFLFVSCSQFANSNTRSFDETVTMVKERIKNADLEVIHTIDHSKNAEKVEMILPRTTLLLIGNPKLGTQLMMKNQQVAIDLPLKILIFQDKAQVKVIYQSPLSVMKDKLPKDLEQILGKMELKLKAITEL